jgi:hypothetical protein
MEDLRAIIDAAAAPIVGVGIHVNLLIQLAHAHRELVGKIMTVGTPMGALPDGRLVLARITWRIVRPPTLREP